MPLMSPQGAVWAPLGPVRLLKQVRPIQLHHVTTWRLVRHNLEELWAVRDVDVEGARRDVDGQPDV